MTALWGFYHCGFADPYLLHKQVNYLSKVPLEFKISDVFPWWYRACCIERPADGGRVFKLIVTQEETKEISSWHLYSSPAIHLPHFNEYIHLKKLNCWHFNKVPPTALLQSANEETRLEPTASLCRHVWWSTLIYCQTYSHPVLCTCSLLAVTVATQCWCLPGSDIWMHETGKDLKLCSKRTGHYKSLGLNSARVVKCNY